MYNSHGIVKRIAAVKPLDICDDPIFEIPKITDVFTNQRHPQVHVRDLFDDYDKLCGERLEQLISEFMVWVDKNEEKRIS